MIAVDEEQVEVRDLLERRLVRVADEQLDTIADVVLREEPLQQFVVSRSEVDRSYRHLLVRARE